MKINKKITGILVTAALTASTLVGCAGFDDTAVALSVGESDLNAGAVNFYSRYQQALTETYYSYLFGEDMWNMEISEGVTYQDNVKDGIVTTFTQLLAVEQHAKDLGVAFTEEEKAAIEEAATAFISQNDEAVLKKVSGTHENVVRIMELLAMDKKCETVMVQDVDTEVSDEEAAQKKVAYTSFYFTTADEDGNSVDLTEEEIADLHEEAEALLEAAKESGDLVATGEEMDYIITQTSFDSESTAISAEMIAAVDGLKEGEFAPIIENDYGYYVAQLVSEFDEEATETKKAAIVEERKDEAYQATADEWVAALDVVVNEAVWDSIDFQDMLITSVTEEETAE